MTEPRIVVDGLHFAEGPRWRDDRLWFSDFYGHRVQSVGADGDLRTELELDDQPSGLGWLPDGRLIVSSMVERKVLVVEDGVTSVHADLSSVATHWLNDLVVDGSGRTYVGNFGFDIDAFIDDHGPAGLVGDPGPPTIPLVMVDVDGTWSIVAEGINFPNGTVITPDGSTLIIAETIGLKLLAFDIAADGSLSNRRVWADLAPQLVSPDGICLDVQGAVWAANCIGTDCVRVAEGGEVLDRRTFGQHVFACTLGGPDLTTLFACTAPSFNAAERTAAVEGRIEAVEVDVAGTGSP